VNRRWVTRLRKSGGFSAMNCRESGTLGPLPCLPDCEVEDWIKAGKPLQVAEVGTQQE
jgi:hypothetical protein